MISPMFSLDAIKTKMIPGTLPTSNLLWKSISSLRQFHGKHSVAIVTECLSDHYDTNKHNNCLISICALNFYLIDEY